MPENGKSFPIFSDTYDISGYAPGTDQISSMFSTRQVPTFASSYDVQMPHSQTWVVNICPLKTGSRNTVGIIQTYSKADTEYMVDIPNTVRPSGSVFPVLLKDGVPVRLLSYDVDQFFAILLKTLPFNSQESVVDLGDKREVTLDSYRFLEYAKANYSLPNGKVDYATAMRFVRAQIRNALAKSIVEKPL